MTKLEEEYHHLSLWYFVSFIFGIIFFFHDNFHYSIYAIYSIIASLVILVWLLRNRNLLCFFVSACLLAFSVGILVSSLRIASINTNPIKKTMISELSGNVIQITPTRRGTQVTLEDVHLFNQHLNKVRINVSNKLIADITHGDLIKLKAKLFPLQSGVLPGTYDFGFYMYMSGIEASGYALTNIEIINKDKNFLGIILRKLDGLSTID